MHDLILNENFRDNGRFFGAQFMGMKLGISDVLSRKSSLFGLDVEVGCIEVIYSSSIDEKK